MKIIIPTDISKSTIKALKFLSFFKESPSIDVDLLYIESYFEQEVINYNRKERISGKVDSSHFSESQHFLIKEITGKYGFVNNILCRSGKLETEILKEVNSGNYDILISATHGVDSLKDMVFGNVTQHLVNESKIPVISLPLNYRISNSNKLLFVSDFNIKETSDFHYLSDLLDVFKLDLHVLKIVDEGKIDEVGVKSDIISFMNSNGLKYDQLYIMGARTIEEGIKHFLEEMDISICAMATHARHGIKHFFLGSMVEQLVDNIDTPLFTFRTRLK